MEYLTEIGYVGLFVAAFLAATILPFSSEVVLSALLLSGYIPVMLISVATIGNVLGSLTNYGLGYGARLGIMKKRVRISEEEMERAERRFSRYGIGCLFFAWVPVIGDPLTVVAGAMRVPMRWFLFLVTAGKFLRYVVVSIITLQVM